MPKKVLAYCLPNQEELLIQRVKELRGEKDYSVSYRWLSNTPEFEWDAHIIVTIPEHEEQLRKLYGSTYKIEVVGKRAPAPKVEVAVAPKGDAPPTPSFPMKKAAAPEAKPSEEK